MAFKVVMLKMKAAEMLRQRIKSGELGRHNLPPLWAAKHLRSELETFLLQQKQPEVNRFA